MVESAPGLRPIGAIAAEMEAGPHVIADLRRQRHVRKLHRLGPHAIDALLIEIGAERSIMTLIERKIERYAALDIDALELAGGDRFPALPIHVVRS